MSKSSATWSETWRRLFKSTNRKDPLVAEVTVGATEELLCVGTATLKGRGLLEIFNASASTIYLGPTGVLTTTGFPVLPNDYYYWYSEDDLYAIAAGAGNAVRVMETK